MNKLNGLYRLILYVSNTVLYCSPSMIRDRTKPLNRFEPQEARLHEGGDGGGGGC